MAWCGVCAVTSAFGEATPRRRAIALAWVRPAFGPSAISYHSHLDWRPVHITLPALPLPLHPSATIIYDTAAELASRAALESWKSEDNFCSKHDCGCPLRTHFSPLSHEASPAHFNTATRISRLKALIAPSSTSKS